MVMTVEVDRGPECGRRDGKGGYYVFPVRTDVVVWTMLAEWVAVSSTRMIMMSTGLAAPNSRDPSSCATTSSSDLQGTRSRPGPRRYAGSLVLRYR